MISDLLDDLNIVESKGTQVAVIGPTLYDERGGSQKMPFIRIGFPRNFAVEEAEGPVECDFLITSGSLTSIKMAQTVGPMMDDLFIYSIDTEWCFRAKHGGACGHRLKQSDNVSRAWGKNDPSQSCRPRSQPKPPILYHAKQTFTLSAQAHAS